MNIKLTVVLSCSLGLLSCAGGSGTDVQQRIVVRSEVVTNSYSLESDGSYVHREWSGSVKGGEFEDGGTLLEFRIERQDNAMLLAWDEITVLIPEMWPAAGPFVIYGSWDSPPVRIEILNGTTEESGEERPLVVSEMHWFRDGLEIDGVMNDLSGGGDYVYTASGLQESSAK